MQCSRYSSSRQIDETHVAKAYYVTFMDSWFPNNGHIKATPETERMDKRDYKPFLG